jgi:hypothetical protein
MKSQFEGGFSAIGMIIAMAICLGLMMIYLRTASPVGPKGGTQGSALEAAKKQAENFEAQQKQRLEAMDQITR